MAQIHEWPKSSMPKAQGWTDEDWELWKAGVWASWWPSKEEWYDHTKSEQPAEPEEPPPKKPKTEEIQEEIHDEVPENPAEPSPGLVECKMEPEVDTLNKQLAAAIAQHQGIFVIFSIPFHFVMYVLWQYCFSRFFNTTLFYCESRSSTATPWTNSFVAGPADDPAAAAGPASSPARKPWDPPHLPPAT